MIEHYNNKNRSFGALKTITFHSQNLLLLYSQLREATWADKLSLLGYDLPHTGYQPGDLIYLTLY